MPDEEWQYQWANFRDDDTPVFEDWIQPFTMEDFTGKTVLECGCGGGHHTAMVAPYARFVTAVDLNTSEIARERCAGINNIEFLEDNIVTMDLGRQFDVVICIGVIHHTDDPDASFKTLFRHCKPGGTIIVWTYSSEGNALVRYIVEPVRKIILSKLPRSVVSKIAYGITAMLYPFVYTIYRLPFLKFLPYYDYFSKFRKMKFQRNFLNVFDKLNAPQTQFITHERCGKWFNQNQFEPQNISIRHYAGVSYCLVGVKMAN